MRSAVLAVVVPLVLMNQPQGVCRAADGADYNTQVKPLLATKCFACHGALRQEAGLRLDASSLIARGSDSGAVVVPGRSGDSLLMERVTADDELRMPPEGEGERLTAEQVALLRRWIDQGAVAPEEAIPQDPKNHWAYQRPKRPAVPAVNRSDWGRNPIDAFIAQQHEAAGLIPAAPAPRAILLRRVYYDLIGLPPTPEQLHAFLADDSPEAYARVVDQLLESPQYGERWGRHWMDVWRYSDWSGFGNEIRYSQPHIWRWRDWIIESLNADRGYDQMVMEMLAADELAPADPQAARATGFLVRNWYKFDRNTWLDDTVEHTAKAFLGLTINCCRCHDHKYDPVGQNEYFQMRAVFEPYDVRADALPDDPFPQAELARAYDARPTAPTYLFVRGDPKQPDKQHPIAPGTPEVLGGKLEVTPVALPVESYYPALRKSALAQRLAEAVKSVAAHEEALASLVAQEASSPDQEASDAPVPAPPPGADDALDLARFRVKLSRAKLAALRAVMLAETKKYGVEANLPDQLKNDKNLDQRISLDEVTAQAAKADRAAACTAAEYDLLAAQVELAAAHRAVKPGDAKLAQAVTAADQKVKAAEKALATARQAAESADKTYQPLGPVYPQQSTGRRRALARWIASCDNPLTARVAVNHIWQRHFAMPLLDHMDDFGLRSARPPLANLLDYLAVELMEGGWTMKRLHRLIVLSRTYQMASAATAAPSENVERDRDNRLLWRMNPRRLEAEAVRDSLFYLAGTLDLTMGGPDLDHGQGLVVPRRSIYFRHAREKQMEFLTIFDAASPIECYQRETSIRPQQAFALMNSGLALTQARQLAQRLTESTTPEQGESDRAFVRAAFETVLTRRPTAEEETVCCQFLREQQARLSNPQHLQAIGSGDAGRAAATDPAQRARENLILVLFNHNDFVTVR